MCVPGEIKAKENAATFENMALQMAFTKCIAGVVGEIFQKTPTGQRRSTQRSVMNINLQGDLAHVWRINALYHEDVLCSKRTYGPACGANGERIWQVGRW